MKRLYFVCLYVLVFLAFGFQCGDKEPGPDNHVYFYEKVSIQPFKREYNVGDTIWIEYLMPEKTLFDSRSSRGYLLDTMEIPVSIYLFSRHPRPGFDIPADENDFRVVHDQNLPLVKRSGAIFTLYGCSQPDYKARLGFVLGNKGVFTMEVNGGYLRNCTGTYPEETRPHINYTFDVAHGNLGVYPAIPETSKHINDDLDIQRKIEAKSMVAFSVR